MGLYVIAASFLMGVEHSWDLASMGTMDSILMDTEGVILCKKRWGTVVRSMSME